MKEPKDLNEEGGTLSDGYCGVRVCDNCGEEGECYEVSGGMWCEKCITGE